MDSFIISAGERVDFVPVPGSVVTNNSAYYMRIRGLNDCDDTKNGVHQHAILRYDNADTVVPRTFPPPTYLNAIKNGLVSDTDLNNIYKQFSKKINEQIISREEFKILVFDRRFFLINSKFKDFYASSM